MENQNCGLCLKPAEDKPNIGVFGEQGIQLGVASILSHHFWFEMKENEDSPQSICTACWLNVHNFHIFYMQIYNAHHKLVEKLDIKEIKVEEPINEIISENTIMNTYIEIMPEKIEDAEEHTIHGDHFADDSTEDIKSNHCDSATNDNEMEVLLIDEPKSSDAVSNLQEKRKKNFKRTKTKRNNEETRQIEREDQQIREYFAMECKLCSTKFQIFQNVKSHYRTSHNTNGYLMCCGRKFFKRCYVLQHIQRHLNPDIFKCHVCNKTYLEKRGLQNHMNTHLPVTEKPFKCNKCPKAFAKNFLLKQHQIRHVSDDEKRFICSDCGKSFASNSILQSHKRGVHEGAYVHICEICAKSFKSKLFYEAHMKSIHSNETIPKVQCQLCGTWLKHEHSLRSHMLRHADANKNYTCKICGKQSPNRGALRSHQQYVHLISRAHKCSICDKAFKKAIGLMEHMTIHTGEVLYTCPHCPKTFNSSANLHSHRKKVHLIEWEANRRAKVINYNEKNE